MKAFITYLFVLTFWVGNALAQDTLSIDEALAIALENNYNVKLAVNNKRISENNKSIYNQNVLPTLSVTGQGAHNNVLNDRSINNIETDVRNKTYPLSSTARLSFRIFDGNRVHSIKKLKEQYELSDIQLRKTILDIIYRVYIAYYQVAELEEQTKNFFENLQLSKRRLERTTVAVEYGIGNELNRLNAEVDVNTDSVAYINTLQNLSNSKRNLNVLLGREVFQTFITIQDINFQELNLLNNYLEYARKNNTEWLIGEKNKAIEALNLKIAKSGWMPNIDLSGGYLWNKTIYENITNDFIRNYGWNAQMSLNWNIFDGGKTKTRVENARIFIDNQELYQAEILRQVEKDVTNAWENYRNSLIIYNFRQTSLKTAEYNYERSLQQFIQGNINSLALRTAQNELLRAKLSLSNAKYSAKVSEINLYRLSGMLLLE